ncbi:rab-GTPase-TBC domain-containing protein [Zychaea mexicana]|uniref:rab-GTPase-TBC domain-containing protein n=1 Tax=Zychaea mexicana TaxID=64656 RepID=UPI0022FF2882|nr:rab-GTPase-TBC domain-containing protein [Zychaea mexicana]KAI9490507.1 rab-GTPase-TBC domain-containing protein [Zychaea mexicana]
MGLGQIINYFETTLRSEPTSSDGDETNNWKPIIDIKSFREACFFGVPDESGLRATAWKVLLGYLPPDKRMWNTVLHSQRLSYYNWARDLLEDPGGEPPSSDHPLNDERGSKWASYFHDNSILDQIDKDVRRTLPDIAFFQAQVPINHLNPLSRAEEIQPPPATEEQSIEDPLSTSSSAENRPSQGRRFSFGFMGRPRSSSTASKKSLRVSAAANNNNNNSNNTRSRSNSKSSVHSTHSNADATASPRNIVRKFSSAFKGGSSTSVLLPPTSSTNPTTKRKHNHNIRNLKPICPLVTNRRILFKRIAHINNENLLRGDNATPEEIARQSHATDLHTQDYHWEAIERILFIYAKLNPGVGYVQGMNEILAPIYYVFAKDDFDLEAQAYAEADAFFVFTILMSDVRDHFVRSLDQDASTGINATMQRMSQRLAWVDKPLWRDLRRKDIKEQYYAFRWITVLCSQEWDLPSVIRLWDSILADRGNQEGLAETRFEFLLDFAVAMVLCIRQDILKGDFAENVRLLQNYPIDDIQVVLATANSLREMRLDAIANGKPVPGAYDKRNSGLFASDWSDTSSIASNGSSTRVQRLRDNADMARQSFDSFRRESRESLDELFRRSGGRVDEAWKRASTGDVTRSLSQRFASVSSKMKRPTADLNRSASISSEHSTAATGSSSSSSAAAATTNGTAPVARSNSLLNRFSQMMGNGNTAVSPYGRLKAARNGLVEKGQQQQQPPPQQQQQPAYYRGFV